MDPIEADGAPPRIERDSMGEVRVPAAALWGAQTQRALQNFPASGLTMPPALLRAMGLIKFAAAAVNAELGDLPAAKSTAIQQAALAVADGGLQQHFPIDLFQTGSGTSTNMNVNEVIARLASQNLREPVSPNDDVNMSQSSNDVVPTAIHVAASLLIEHEVLPSLRLLSQTLALRATEFADLAKTGRTHLMDAMPVTLGQEIGAWKSQIDACIERFTGATPRVRALAQGGTAVGTGINARAQFAPLFARRLSEKAGIAFTPNGNLLAALASQDTAVEVSGHARTLAVSLMKICNDLRWMNSGPLAGLGEIALPALQPGSSIMPGKVNPVIPEAVAMMAAQIVGNDAAVTLAAQSGNFQLNVMLPLIAHNLLQSLSLAALGCRSLAQKAVAGFSVDRERIAAQLERNPILVTALNPIIGYERGAAIAKRAYEQRRSILDVAVEMTGMDRAVLEPVLDALELTRGGVKAKAVPH